MHAGPAAAASDDALPVRAARARYFAENDFGDDGGYSEKWVHLKLGPIPISFPNTAARVAAVKLHDLHHVATGYPTTPTGEAEIGAWEVASGCGSYVAAWMLNLWAMGYGNLLAPATTYAAFLRGRRSTNLYHAPPVDDALLDASVGELRERLKIPAETPEPAASDRAAFVAWSGVAAAWGLLTLALPVAGIWGLVRLLF